MGVPCAGIDEDADDEGHAEQGQRREAGEKAERHKEGHRKLGIGAEMGGEFGGEERHAVFVAEEADREIGDVPAAVDLCQSRLPEDAGDADARGELNERERHEPFGEAGETADGRGFFGRGGE